MPSCPVCQTELPDDFGLIDCPGCEAALFIEMDGTVQASSPPTETPEFAEPQEFEGTVVDQLVDELAEEPEPHEPEESAAPAEPVWDDIPPEPEPQPEPEPFSEPVAEPIEDQPLEVSEAIPDEVAAADISQLADVMDEQGAIEGLRYDLKIAGIDSADLRREVYEALTDKKLGWNTEELMETVKDGVLELKAISAVKAQVVVQRLKTLPLQIRWSQYGGS